MDSGLMDSWTSDFGFRTFHGPRTYGLMDFRLRNSGLSMDPGLIDSWTFGLPDFRTRALVVRSEKLMQNTHEETIEKTCHHNAQA
jgi:hypothetical protein